MATAVVAGSGLFPFPLHAGETNPAISIVLDKSDPFLQQTPVSWAVQQLQDTLAARGVTVQLREQLGQVPPSQECIVPAGRASKLAQQVLEAATISLPDAPECLAAEPTARCLSKVLALFIHQFNADALAINVSAGCFVGGVHPDDENGFVKGADGVQR